MPLLDIFGRMALEKIWVERGERQRWDPDPEKGGLLASIALRGVIVPVILESEPDERGYHRLLAGERRYSASLNLGLADIPYRFAHEPDETELQIIELEENIKRVDLSWQETCQAVVRIHGLYKEGNPEQTYEATGRSLALQLSIVAKYHFINESWGMEVVRGAGTLNEAYNLLQRKMRRIQAGMLDDVVGGSGEGEGDEEDDTRIPSNNGTVGGISSSADNVSVGSGSKGFDRNNPNIGTNTSNVSPSRFSSPCPSLPILREDFLTWGEEYVGVRFNLIHCDFPYGVKFADGRRSGPNTFHREEEEIYADEAEVYWGLLGALVRNFDKFASESCHLMFWFSDREGIGERTRELLRKIPGMKLTRFPLVWLKSDNAGFITPGEPRHIYETCLLGTRGDRPIVRYVSDAYSSPSDNSLHVSTKPEPMLKYFMGMLVDEHSKVLDPTCGSGGALRAAEALRAERVLGLELSEGMTRVANKAMLEARAKRVAAGGAK